MQDIEVIAHVTAEFISNQYGDVHVDVSKVDRKNGWFAISIKELDASGKPVDPRYADLLLEAKRLKWLELVDKVVAIPSIGAVKLVGYKSTARKNPWIIEQLSSKKHYVINDEQLEQFFGVPATTWSSIKAPQGRL